MLEMLEMVSGSLQLLYLGWECEVYFKYKECFEDLLLGTKASSQRRKERDPGEMEIMDTRVA